MQVFSILIYRDNGSLDRYRTLVNGLGTDFFSPEDRQDFIKLAKACGDQEILVIAYDRKINQMALQSATLKVLSNVMNAIGFKGTYKLPQPDVTETAEMYARPRARL